MTEGTKRCPRCEQILPATDFHRDTSRADGRYPLCKPCRLGAINRDRARAAGRAYYASNRERLQADGRARYWADKDRAREQHRAFRLADPYYKERRAEGNRRRAAARYGVQVGDFTLDQIRDRLSMCAGCWICGGPGGHVDHVKPLSKGGAHLLCNLRRVCNTCNASKGDTWPYRPHPRQPASGPR